jgi:hypothetical protein
LIWRQLGVDWRDQSGSEFGFCYTPRHPDGCKESVGPEDQVAGLDLLVAEVSETLESVGLLAVGLSDLKNALSTQTEMTRRILAILTAEPEKPSPLEETLRNIHATLRALDERLQRIEQALTK